MAEALDGWLEVGDSGDPGEWTGPADGNEPAAGPAIVDAEAAIHFRFFKNDYFPPFSADRYRPAREPSWRYVVGIDAISAKQTGPWGLFSFKPLIPLGISPSFFSFISFWSALCWLTFPFSKLMHAGGHFLFPPTRTMPQQQPGPCTMKNPWNYPGKNSTPTPDYENGISR